MAHVMAHTTDVDFVDRSYGKKYVRLLHVTRHGDVHRMKEIRVDTALTLNDTQDYLHGDNSKIIATDSQKNTVYVMAKKHGVKSIENFALLLSDHFLEKYDQVEKVQIYVMEKPWRRILQNGVEHKHAFIGEGSAIRYCQITQTRNISPVVSSGLNDMHVLKTTKSAFKNFVTDEFRTLPDAEDRVFCTVVNATWTYAGARPLDFDYVWRTVKDSVLEAFAGPTDIGVYSPSVQKTLYDAAKTVFNRIPEVAEITIELPNVHAYEFDFSRLKGLGLENKGEIFQPTSEPSGNIKATLKRNLPSKL